MQQGDPVIFMGPMSESNGHFEQPAIVTKVWTPSCVNVKVFPDTGNNVYDATSIMVVADAAAGAAIHKAAVEKGNQYWQSVCWPASAANVTADAPPIDTTTGAPQA